MSAATNPLEVCLWPVEPHHFAKIVKCTFKCKSVGYKTYRNLHKHYLTVHKICLHRVAQLDPNNEDEFCRQLSSFLAALTGGNTTSNGSQRHNPYDHATSCASNFPGPGRLQPTPDSSHLGGYQTPGDTVFHPSPVSPGQGGPSNPPGWYAAPTFAESPYQNCGPSSRHPAPGGFGPSRSPVVSPTARHQPYPQSRSNSQGMCMGRSTARGQARGKRLELHLTTTDGAPPTPNTVLLGNHMEPPTPTTRPHDGAFVELLQYPSADLQYTRSQQAVIETSMPSQWALAPQYPAYAITPGTFHRPATAQGHRSPADSTRESGGTMLANHPWLTQHQQLQPIATGSRGPVMASHTPPVVTDSSPDGSPRRLPNQPKRSPRRVNQNYPRPVNGSTTSQLTRQAREYRQRKLSTGETSTSTLGDGQTLAVVDVQHPVPDHCGGRKYTGIITPGLLGTRAKETSVLFADRPINPSTEQTPTHTRPSSKRAQQDEPPPFSCSAPLRAPATASQGQAKPRASQEIDDAQWLGELHVVRDGPASSEPCGGVRIQNQSSPATSDTVERPQTAEEPTPLALLVQEPSQELVPIQRPNSGVCHPTTAASEDNGALRKGGSVRGAFPDVPGEGWRLIRTPDGIYLPETFNPFPHELEDLTDQR